MTTKLFQKNNPNSDIFQVPQELGGEDGDNQIASIGDATMNHIESLGQARILLDSFVVMPDGNLFAVEESTQSYESDELGLGQVKDLEDYLKKNKIPAKYHSIYQEAFREEQEKKAKSEDVMDNADFLIPYHQWEEFPQMSKHWETPKTPKQKLRYVGNCSTPFYDYLPEDHPDKQYILKFLYLINRDVDDISPKFIWAVRKNLENSDILDYTRQCLSWLVEAVTEQDPEQCVIEALTKLDEQWGEVLYKQACKNEARTDAVYGELSSIGNQYKAQAKNGVSANAIYQSVKDLGYRLFHEKNPFAEKGIPGKLKKRHWTIYHKIKKHFAPAVVVKGIDINRAYVSDIAKVLNISRDRARKIFFARPFENIDKLLYNGYITLDDLSTTPTNPDVAECMEIIKQESQQAVSTNSLAMLNAIPAKVISHLRGKRIKLNRDEYKTIWSFYHAKKTSFKHGL